MNKTLALCWRSWGRLARRENITNSSTARFSVINMSVLPLITCILINEFSSLTFWAIAVCLEFFLPALLNRKKPVGGWRCSVYEPKWWCTKGKPCFPCVSPLPSHCSHTSLLTPRCMSVPHIEKFSNTSQVFYNLTQFWHYLSGDGIRSYRLRAHPARLFPLQMPITRPCC